MKRSPKLPVEDVAAVVNLQAGVVDGHFRGGRANEVKYLVDGVSVNDVFSGESSMEAEVNSIAEIQVLSGTFNAEYGEALSGVVNQMTKVACENYTRENLAYTGDYLSSRTDQFKTITRSLPVGGFQDFRNSRLSFTGSPSKLYNLQGSLSGPVPLTGGLLKFFASGSTFTTRDTSTANGCSTRRTRRIFPRMIRRSGTSARRATVPYVPMNYQDR